MIHEDIKYEEIDIPIHEYEYTYPSGVYERHWETEHSFLIPGPLWVEWFNHLYFQRKFTINRPLTPDDLAGEFHRRYTFIFFRFEGEEEYLFYSFLNKDFADMLKSKLSLPSPIAMMDVEDIIFEDQTAKVIFYPRTFLSA